ncbi:Flp pilus assembly protein, pilin Flp [Mariprofundus aestuarium]|uniref:Flp pilus assembly protein, pilin Flp n=1 Tax=Mariprofundus aestuarium TaxID=1921086 RepID=A0A2K8L2C0_MARES|nr:hypothetical protein [Mariprofundus aestuarium]ATX79991.1 Flp pilus assembly protein, pilin Flp [Mariprofundus aestuarium]
MKDLNSFCNHRLTSSLHSNEQGVSTVEYAIIISSLSIAATIILVFLGAQIEGSFNNLADTFGSAMDAGGDSGRDGGGKDGGGSKDH